MALDIFRRVPTDCDIWDSWASWWFTRCSCCRIWFWRSSWVELTEFVFVESREGEPVVASRLYLVFWLRMTLGTKLLLLWPEAEVGLDKDVMSMGVWKLNSAWKFRQNVMLKKTLCFDEKTQFWLRMTLGTKLLLLWPEAEVGLDKDVMSMGVWKFVNNGTLLRKVVCNWGHGLSAAIKIGTPEKTVGALSLHSGVY